MTDRTDAPPEWRQQGEGPHPTLAGNILDPGIKADGSMFAGQGVGGTSEGRIMAEGEEHMKKTQRENSTPGGIGSSSGAPISSSTGYGEGTTVGEQQPHGLMGTVKSYLGYGNEPTTTTGDSAYGSGLSGNEAAGAGALGAGAGSALGSDSARDRTADIGESRDITANDSTYGTDPMKRSDAAHGKPTDSDVTTGRQPTDSADPTTKDSAMSEREEREEGRETKDSDAPKKESSGKEGGAAREHEDAIPYAGGEKLGQKHWGESKIVPDNPKPRESEANVSSAEGQPTQQVKDNTNQNTGGAAPPAHIQQGGNEGAEKESMMDKMKTKLHLGGHK